MEPRPQRPRSSTPPSGQTSRQRPAGSNPPPLPGEYQGDPTDFVAPQRTEYDYSPLDLAPPGQRRRRQLVAAAIGALSVLLLGGIVVFGYLLLRDEDPPSQNDDLLAAQTQVANQEATLIANQTVVAQVAAEQTNSAAVLNGDPTEEPAQPEETQPADTTGTEEAPANDQATEEPSTGQTAEETPDVPDLSGNASLDEDGLAELLPLAAQVPADLTDVLDTTRTMEQVVESLGGGRPAETSLEEWGWSGNVDRAFQVPDPAAVADPAGTTYLGVSVHGFGSPTGAEGALATFSDVLISGQGYTELSAPDIGDEATMLTLTNEDGATNVYLYVRDGSVLYRILGSSPAGDPSQDVMTLANDLIGN